MKTRFTRFSIQLLFALLLYFVLNNTTYAQTYCNSSFSNVTYEFVTNVTFSGINNTTGGNTGGPVDYTALGPANVTQGTSYPLSLTIDADANDYVYVFIDWNQNGVLNDPGEEYTLASATSSNGPFTLNIVVPIGAQVGNTRMRVMVDWNNSAPNPCRSATYGEAEDYTINVNALVACAGQPTAGTIPDTLYVCPSDPFSLVATGSTLAGSMSNQWQSSPAGTNIWSDITGAIYPNHPMAAGVTVPTDFRYIASCTVTSLSDTSNVMTAMINPPGQCYCTPAATNTNYYIDDFSTTGGTTNITNNNTGFSSNGYADYTTDTVSALQGSSVSISADFSSYSNWGARIWIDWNQNGTFTDPGEEIFATSSYTYSLSNIPVTVPASATTGNTRLRIRISYTPAGGPDPCSSLSNFGETEDYTFQVIPPPLCDTSVLPLSVVAFANIDTLCISGDVDLDLDTTLMLSGITYQWQKSASATGPWFDIDSTQNFPPKSVANIDTTTWFRCQILCSGSPAITSNSIQVQVNNPQLIGTPLDGSRCGPGTVTLSATGSAGSTVNWYDAATGGMPIGTGPTLNTPNINNTTDYYVAASMGGNATPGSLAALSGGTNGCGGGVMFDIIPSVSLNIDSFTALTNGTGTVVNVYYKNGTYSGNGTSASAWTLAATLNISYTSGQIITIPLPASINLSAGNTYGIYLNYYSGYTTGTGSNQTFSNSEMTLNAGYGLCSDFGGVNDPRVFNGTVFYHQPGCESPRQIVTATIDPVPMVDLGNDTTICDPNAALTLDATSPGSSYVWNTAASGQTITASAPGIYSVTVTGSNGCNTIDSIELIQGIIPQDDLPDSIDLCSGSSIILNAGNPGSMYSWNNAQTSQVISVSAAGNYAVAITSPSGCVLNTSTEVIEIPLPFVDLGTDTILCPGSSLTLNAAGSSGSSYIWNNNATTSSLYVFSAGTYAVTATGSNGCVNSDTVEITTGVFPQNTLSAILNLCEEDTAVLDAGNTGSTYLWNTGETTQTIEVTTPDNYTVIITNEMACVLNATSEVILQPLPIINLGSDTIICLGTAITLDAGNAGSNFSWNTGATTQTISVSDSGNYSVSVTSSYNCIASGDITVSTLPGANVNGFNFIPLFYEDLGKIKFHANEPDGVTDYQWDFGDGSSSNNAEPEHIYANSGDYLVTLTVSNDCGYQSSSLLIHVDLTVGIVSIEHANPNIILYPNPAKDKIIIENKNPDIKMEHISVYNQLGARVYTTLVTGTQSKEIPVWNLASGMYSVIIQTNKNGSISRKFEVIR